MCGIVGWISRNTPVPRRGFEAATDALAHRGPDGRGTWYNDADRIALGHRRLAIVDLSDAGSQPMHLHEHDLHLTYNGEIYNHAELRQELEARGCVYRSSCDSETILHAYAQWGGDCVKRFRGIFAFAIWDGSERRLFAARDHLGVKPFYYAATNDALVFASQPAAFANLPGLKPHIDPNGFLDYLGYGIVPGERSIFRHVGKLLPGHSLSWHNGRVQTATYWQVPRKTEIHDLDEAVNAIENAIEDSVSAQMMSDVPVATFLSGGVDSSLVTSIASKKGAGSLTAYTMGFDIERSDERPFAALAAEYCDAKPVVGVIGNEDFQRSIDDAVDAYDEPFGISAAMPMVAISRLASEHGAKVVLTGDGADELFAGYRHYDDLADYYRLHGRETGNRIAHFGRALMARLRGTFDPLTIYKSHNVEIRGSALAAICGRELADHESVRWREARHFDHHLGPVEAARRCDLATYLPDEILVKVDRATMAFGIEARIPFLDPALVELAFKIAPELHFTGDERKALLKQAASKWLPQEILTTRKKGFSFPIFEWMKLPGNRERLLSEIREGRLVSEGWINSDNLDQALRKLPRPAAALLQLYLAERWARRWLV